MNYLTFKAQLNAKGKSQKKQNRKNGKNGKRRASTKKITAKSKIQKPLKVAKKTLKENLKQEYQVSITVDGNTDYVAGARIELDKTWGKFEGVYSIEKVTHNISGGDYTCDLEMLKVGAKEKATEKAKQQTKAEKAAKEAKKIRNNRNSRNNRKNKNNKNTRNSKNNNNKGRNRK